MNILATQYTLPYRSLEIYVAGCNGNPHCEQCFNPESWNFENGTKYTQNYFNEKIKQKVTTYSDLIKNIMIFGGEPLDQNHTDFMQMLKDLHNLNLPIWIFTRHDIKSVPNDVKKYCTYLKCGRYIPNLKTDSNVQYGIKLATSNQKIYKKGIDF